MRLDYLVAKPFLLATLLLLAACHDDDKPQHEGEGQLMVTVDNPGNQALTLRVFGKGLEEPLENRFEAGNAADILEAWLPVGAYDALLTGSSEEITLDATGSFDAATATVNIPEGSSTMPALNSPVYVAAHSDITVTEGEKRELSLTPEDIRQILRLTVTVSDGRITSPIEATLGSVAREVSLVTSDPVSSATLGLSLPAPGAEQTSRALAGILGIVWPRENESATTDNGHMLTLTWQTADGKKQTSSEDVSEQLFRPSQSGADTLDLAVTIGEEAANVPIHLYTGIKTRAMIDEFKQTPVCIAAGTTAGQYTE